MENVGVTVWAVPSLMDTDSFQLLLTLSELVPIPVSVEDVAKDVVSSFFEI